MADTAVKPPFAAAIEPVSTVSESSLPGSRKWVWRSTNPCSAIVSLPETISKPSFANRSPKF